MRVDVKFGTTTHSIEVPGDDATATFGQLKELIRAATGVLPPMQKLLGKPNLQSKPDDATLLSLGIKDKTKLMLIGSSAEEVIKSNAPASQAEKATEETQEKLLRSLPYNFWAFAPFAGFLADPYVAGRGHPLEGGSALMALLSLDIILSRINTLGASAAKPFANSARLLVALGQEGSAQVAHRFLKTMTTAHRTAVQRAHAVVRACMRFTMDTGNGKFPDNVIDTVDRCTRAIDSLPVGEHLMLPAGWLGMRSYNIIYLLVFRKGPDAFDVIVVNKGAEGSEYHPRWQTAEKLKSCAVLRLERVARERLLDRTFWLLCFAQWLNRDDPNNRSEFVRAEVFYDVLLPWLVEPDPKDEKATRFATELLLQHPHLSQTQSAERNGAQRSATASSSLTAEPFDPFVMAHGGSTPASASSGVKSAVEAFCYLLEEYGQMTREEVKQVKFALKYEYFLRAAEDLIRLSQRFLLSSPAASSASATPAVPAASARTSKTAAVATAVPNAAVDASGATETAQRARLTTAVGALKTAVGTRKDDGTLTVAGMLSEAAKLNVIVKSAANVILRPTHFENKMVLVYVGTLAAPGAKKFAAVLADTAKAIVEKVKATTRLGATSQPLDVEFLMLSCDDGRETYDEHAAMFSFPRAAGPCGELCRALEVAHAPEVIVFGRDGTLLHRQGVKAVRQDPEAELFPGGPWIGAEPLSATDVRMLQVATAQLARHAQKRFDRHALSEDDTQHVVELVQAVTAVVAALPQDDVHAIAKAAATVPVEPQPDASKKEEERATESCVDAARRLDATLSGPLSLRDGAGFHNAELLPTTSKAQYYGKAFKATVPVLEDICRFTPATRYSELFSILMKSKHIVASLWARASHSGTASRVAVQMHIIEFVTWIFSTMVPVPLPPSGAGAAPDGSSADGGLASSVPAEERSVVAAFYHTDCFTALPDDSDMQLELLDAVYYLMLSLANAWQAVENPSRSFDAERCLIAMDMLVVFDAIARHERGSAKGHMMAVLLCADGGYYPSTSLGKQTVAFARAAATLELTRPRLLPVRSAMLRYIQWQQKELRHELFDLRMPDKLELRKGSTTVTFLRTFLDNCGYSLDGAGGMMGQNASEMDKLMEWLCGPRTPLAREHREFGLYRDMVLLAKFLGTLEMRDAQLLHRRKELDPLASWRLSFEEDAPGRQMSAGWRTRPSPPKWECVMVRGRDMDIADLIVKGFGDREVMYGEGLSLQSPIDVSRLIEVDHPTEDDVLHAKSMPTFGGTMSPEEAEVLLSCLTTPYVRIPLILDFFSSQDRNTYLFVRDVQEALRAVLFEPGAYASAETLQSADPRTVPMRLNAQQRADAELRRLRGDHSRKDYEECLGTTHGLLLNEIAHAPAAVLGPLRRILGSVTELGPSSVYSSNASYVLFVVGLACDVLSFCRFTMHLKLGSQLTLVAEYHDDYVSFLHRAVQPLLREWLSESESNADTPTQCVLYAYKSMVDRALWKGLCVATSLTLTPLQPPVSPQQLQQLRSEETERQLVKLLQDCSFVRARHGFGMGVQRTQLAAQEGDNLLTPEEKMLRFLQAQGLDTSHVSQQMLEQGRQLMMSGGRRRAVFVQIRSRFYNDTVRVPNLLHSDPSSTTESKLLKLPPADVPENTLFAYLLEDHMAITKYLDAQSASRRGAIFQRVVQAVLRDHAVGSDGDDDAEAESSGRRSGRASRSGSEAPLTPGAQTEAPSGRKRMARREGHGRSPCVSTRASVVHLDQLGDSTPAASATAEDWTVASPGVYRGPAASGLLFHVQTCELFWRNDELRPVPDSMSHFTDYENVLGKEILQCGLVSRHEHRHWVHIVGTPYDVVEWSAPPRLDDQGVHSPVIVEGSLPAEPVLSCVFEGVTYDRPVAVDEEDPWPVKEERWAVEMVRQVMHSAFPGGMKFAPLAPALPTQSDAENEEEKEEEQQAQGSERRANHSVGRQATGKSAGAAKEVSVLRFIMNDAPQYEDEEDRATWKEIVAYRYPQPHFDLFNLVPHARKLYRSLVFSTNQRFSLHSLALLPRERSRETLTTTAFQAGELKRRTQRESTLEIHRYNDTINGREVYVPARLLQGLIPSALLESFFFWQGEDDVLRGYPLSDESSDASVLGAPGSTADESDGAGQQDTAAARKKKQKQNAEMLDHWFSYGVEVYLGTLAAGSRRRDGEHAALCTIVRRDDKTHTLVRSRVGAASSAAQVPGSPRDHTARRHLLNRVTSAESLSSRTLGESLPSHAQRAAGPHADAGRGDAGEEDDEEEEGQQQRQVQRAMRESEVSLVHAALSHLPLEVCAAVLERGGGDIAAALQWATSPDNEAELLAIVQQSSTASSQSPQASASPQKSVREDKVVGALRPGDRVLINLLHCRALAPLLELFTSLEDPSHILVWGTEASGASDANATVVEVGPGDSPRRIVVESVELPRLRARFIAQHDDTSARLRLFLADQPGWRVAEVDDLAAAAAHSHSLRALRDPFQQCLVLCNGTHEVAFMVPNHDFLPMQISGDPFNALLLFDRSSFTWRESVPSAYYVYPVHSSKAFLLPATLSASLYYAVMQCATQHYSGAFRTLESCYTDSPFSPEEAFMFALFERTVADAYPDAHAVRLKVAHAVQYSSNEYQWSLPSELTGYLHKLRHVSSDCRLKRSEVLDLLKRCNKAVPLVRSQLELYAGLLSAAKHDANKTHALVTIKTPSMDRCGFPWERLLLYPWEKISPQKLKRVTYSALSPDKLADAKLVQFLYSDELLGDEESGANTKRGFYFLYSMKKGDLKPVLLGQSVAASFSQLMARWFHLRHARWGREAQAGGETELAPSWCATVLQLMELYPSASWPATVDAGERYMMARGINLLPGSASAAEMNWDEHQHERRSSVPDLFDRISTVARDLFTVSSTTVATREARKGSQLRTPESRGVVVNMHDHIVPRVLPLDTSVANIELRDASISAKYFGNSTTHRAKTLQALCVEPLSELDLLPHGILSASTAASRRAAGGERHEEPAGAAPGPAGGGDALPFSIRAHPLARTPLAQNMLDRLEEDSARFVEQQQDTTRYAFVALSQESVHQLLSSNARQTVVAALGSAEAALARCEEQLLHLATQDARVVAQLTQSVLDLANGVHDGADAPQPAGGTGGRAALQTHKLNLARRERVPVTVEWLCGGLLSTGMATELRAMNPFHGDLEQLRAELVLLMLLSSRGFLAEQSALAVQNLELFLEFCCLARGVTTGGKRESLPSGKGRTTAAQRRERVKELAQHFSLEIQPHTLAQMLDSVAAAAEADDATGLLMLPEDVAHMLTNRLQQLLSAALDLITAKRFYTTVTKESSTAFGFALDPRFLVFEFLFNILLRARQVEMVRWFVSNTLQGRSRVQQMIMGQGKTTVVGPLLALILGDGTQLVTQVMPTALLEQTRGILRRCFSVVVVKHIYTLQFDRSFDDAASGSGDSGGVELLYQKLRSAEEDRSVVVAAPECIKSLFLKEIEQLHMIETVPTADLDEERSTDERHAAHATALRKKTVARSAMADAITPILQLWKRGVLIMDEVDVLLHPLRSELNFPIGLKHPIDMSGHRWLLPIHLLDAVFYHQRGKCCEDVQHLLRLAASSLATTAGRRGAGHAPDTEGSAVRDERRAAALDGVRAAVAKGFAQRSLQREPHLVLLDVAYYESDLLPALVPWLQLWLHEQIIERLSSSEQDGFALTPYAEFVKHTTPFLLDAVKADESTSAVAAFLNAHVNGFGVKLLNLAHDWLHRLLPHVLSKIDRVSFGVLQPNDLALTAASSADVARIPFSRKMMAVPFVAKDVPSRSSEFAHPDVVIGLTVLGFRYEGLRVKDVRELVLQLKQDFARQAGPKEHRPAAKLYRRWLQLSAEDREIREAAARTHDAHRGHPLGAGEPDTGAEPNENAALCFERAGVPLSQLQVTDRAQLLSLHRILHAVPEVVHYYLCSCVFPRTMNFQRVKISACGHELGSSMLFTKRIGFSGTPSNLLPLDLGECFYEPGSDGRVLSVLTNPEVAHAEVLPDSWTPLRVLDRIASAQPPLSALIDAGALITNMDNEEVARYLLQRLPEALFDGVVFMDSRDRQMILQRDNGLVVPVAQCGVSLSRRFTFFDQVHTTGTDVKQSATATAVITLGKDLVFRDYAQGAYRMRGIGRGQRLALYLIPEVTSRIHEVLGAFKTGDLLRDVPAWLLLNSMKVEGLQFFKLSLQELANVWRKKAVRNLVRDSIFANAHADLFSSYLRSRRFHLERPASCADDTGMATVGSPPQNEEETGAADAESSAVRALVADYADSLPASSLPTLPLLRCSIEEFRETIEYPVESRVEAAKPFLAHLQEIIESRPRELIEDDAASQALVAELLHRIKRSVEASREAHEGRDTTASGSGSKHAGGAVSRADQTHQTMDLNAEMVHEQEAEEEQEQEAEQEEQRISAFSRDDEFMVPWEVATLRRCGADPAGTLTPTNGCCFYQLNSFQVRASQPHLRVDPRYLLTDNYFRLDWHGVGERRLKNTFLFLEWIPVESSPSHLASQPSGDSAAAAADRSHDVCSGLLTLAEGESLRWLLHHSSHTQSTVAMALRIVSTGRYMDATGLFSTLVRREGVDALHHLPTSPFLPAARALPAVPHLPPLPAAELAGDAAQAPAPAHGRAASVDVANSPERAALLFRFFNNDMFFSDDQLEVLEYVLRDTTPADRLQFFVECLRVRRRHRNHWEDAPIAVLFVSPDDRGHLRQLAIATRLQLALQEMLEVLVKAARPKCKNSVRKEAQLVQLHLETFTVAVSEAVTSSATDASAPIHGHSSSSSPVKESGSEGDSRRLSADRPVDEEAAANVTLPASFIASALVESFPRTCRALSNRDVAQAVCFAVGKRRSAARAATGAPAAPAEDLSDDDTRVALADVYGCFPALDLGHVHRCLEHGSVSPPADASLAASHATEPHAPHAGHRKGAEEAGEEEEEESAWSCEVCTYVNEASSRACAMCLTVRPRKASTPLNGGDGAAAGAGAVGGAARDKDEDEDEEEDVDGPWQCEACTFINDSRTQTVCAVCLANNPHPLRDGGANGGAGAGGDPLAAGVAWECPEGSWVCSVEHGGCSKFNPNTVFYCQVCEKARPNLASVRF